MFSCSQCGLEFSLCMDFMQHKMDSPRCSERAIANGVRDQTSNSDGQASSCSPPIPKNPEPSTTAAKCDLCPRVFARRTRMLQHKSAMHKRRRSDESEAKPSRARSRYFEWVLVKENVHRFTRNCFFNFSMLCNEI